MAMSRRFQWIRIRRFKEQGRNVPSGLGRFAYTVNHNHEEFFSYLITRWFVNSYSDITTQIRRHRHNFALSLRSTPGTPREESFRAAVS
jgi:hypothetical protein